MDVFLTGGTILVFLALVESVLTSALADRGRRDLAKRIDRCSRLGFPTVLILLVLIAFWWW
ncbi:MAG: hypothetical protein OEM49_05665 [Myxococcales bacterium]|nr:hypothetical protein [Myxococcales bacterium]MDH5307467.1 hypothetical protein [Myxococcales bacterium]MDH5566929.1 hypothetical protein [Myxococcales bacterium]